MKVHILKFTLCAILLTSSTDAATFTDDFNRPDSASVGNGWLDMSLVGFTLEIRNNEVLYPHADAATGIYRLASFTDSITVSATLKEMNGFGGLLKRYDASYGILSNGTIGSGYRLQFGRGDQSFNDSEITLFDGNNLIATVNSTFQYGSQIGTNATFNRDGSVIGSVTNGLSTFNFSFPAHTPQSNGTNFAYFTSGPDSRAATLTYPRLDNVTLTVPEPTSVGLIFCGAALCFRRRTLRTHERSA